MKLGRRTERRRIQGEEEVEMQVGVVGVVGVAGVVNIVGGVNVVGVVGVGGVPIVDCAGAGGVAGAGDGGQEEEVLAHGVGPLGGDRPLLPSILVQTLSRL